MRNGLFYVAKEEGSDEVLGIAMWLRPQRADQSQSWGDWFEGWRLWFSQVGMNAWYGRGGLNVKVGLTTVPDLLPAYLFVILSVSAELTVA
jgi:hypothetical protein